MNLAVAATASTPAVAAVDSALADRWISYLDASPSTVATYTKGVRQFIRWMAGNGVTRPTRSDVLAYRAEMASTRKATTVANCLVAVKLFFKWLAQEGLYENVADRVKAPKIDHEHKRDYLVEAQVRRVLGGIDRSTVGGLRDYAIVALMVTTGLRIISVVRADVADLRPAGGSMALYYQGKGHVEKAKYVKIDESVDVAIREYLKARGKVDGADPLFASVAHRNGGERLTTTSVSRLVKTAMRNVGIDSDRTVPHSLRHTAATLNILGGGTYAETQQLLDHANISTTMIYAHALDRAKNDSEHRIARMIFG